MKPTVLLVSGMLNDASVWQEVAKLLLAQADVRFAVPLQDSIAAMAEAAWQELAGLPETTPVVLAGFSLGGYVVQEMLARPGRGARPVRAAVLISTSPRPETPESAAQRERTMAAMQRDFGRVVQGLVSFATHQAAPALVQQLRAMMLSVGAENAIRQNRAILARADHRAALAELRLPVAVLCGAQDQVTPPERSQEAATLIPGAQLTLIDGAGHMLPCEQPQAVSAALLALLHSVAP